MHGRLLGSSTDKNFADGSEFKFVDQMEFRIENTDGYLNSSWRDHGIALQVL